MSYRKFEKITTTIAASGSLSSAIPLGKGGVIQAIQIPSAWTAAGLSFQSSLDGGTTYQDVYYDESGTDTEFTYPTTAASRNIHLYPDLFAGATHIKIRSGTSGTPVVQAAERELIISIEQKGR